MEFSIPRSRNVLPREEAERRNAECKRRYYERNKEMLLEKARLARQADPEYNTQRKIKRKQTMQQLIDAGVYQPAKRGRKRLYETPEEAHTAKKQQLKESHARRKERIAKAMADLAVLRLNESPEICEHSDSE